MTSPCDCAGGRVSTLVAAALAEAAGEPTAGALEDGNSPPLGDGEMGVHYKIAVASFVLQTFKVICDCHLLPCVSIRPAGTAGKKPLPCT